MGVSACSESCGSRPWAPDQVRGTSLWVWRALCRFASPDLGGPDRARTEERALRETAGTIYDGTEPAPKSLAARLGASIARPCFDSPNPTQGIRGDPPHPCRLTFSPLACPQSGRGRMVARIATVAFEGIESRAVDVQVLIAPGLPAFAIVGLPETVRTVTL